MTDEHHHFGALPTHGRFEYRAIDKRPAFRWPGNRTLAVYIGFNIEHFAFGSGLGATLGPPQPQPDVLNYSWREYGNRVGVWRCMELFDQLRLPVAALINTALYEHCPDVIEACVERGYELVGHGHTNSERQGTMSEADERRLIIRGRDIIDRRSGRAPNGWLSPWISESAVTCDLLAEEGYRYTLNWCHDDQPVAIRTRGRERFWSIPYPQEVNDIPAIMARQMDGADFAQLIIDNFDEMREQSRHASLVMGIALHPYIVGQPYRLRHRRRALEHIAAAQQSGDVWFTTPEAICEHANTLAEVGQHT